MSSQPLHDNILYLDFDGTLTGVSGSVVFSSGFCQKFKGLDTPEQRSQLQQKYNEADPIVKITPEAKGFLKEMTGLYPQVKIVIVSRNFENYIRALLEFESIDTSNITIYPRGKGRSDVGLGERKFNAVKFHETLVNPGFRLICDDTETDYDEMISGATKSGNQIVSHSNKPGEFKWENYVSEVKCHIKPIQSVTPNDNGKSYIQLPVLFRPVKTKVAAGVGLTSGVGAVTIAVLASTSILTLNLITLGLVVGILAAISVGALTYTGIKTYQNYNNNDEPSRSEYAPI